MEKVIAVAIPALFIVGIIWLIVASNKRINNALSTASKTLGFTYIPSKNIFRKKRIFGELDGFKCEVEVTQEVMDVPQLHTSPSLLFFQRALVWD